LRGSEALNRAPGEVRGGAVTPGISSELFDPPSYAAARREWHWVRECPRGREAGSGRSRWVFGGLPVS